MHSIRIKNFKGFEDTGYLELRPITILIGPNSSGKSSLIQPLLMLKQTVDSRDVTSPLVVNGSYVKLSSYESFIHHHDVKKKLEIDISMPGRRRLIFSRNLKEREYSRNQRIVASFIFNKSKKRIELDASTLSLDGTEVAVVREKLKKTIRYSVKSTLNKEFMITPDKIEPVTITIPRVIPYKFYSYFSKTLSSRGLRRVETDLRRIEYDMRSNVEDFLNSLNYIGPLRETPKSFYVSGGELRKDVGIKGEYATDVLWTQSQGTSRSKNLLKKVNYWINKFGLGKEVKLKTVGRHSGFFQVIIKNLMSEIDATISDVGFGVSQVLPLIIEGFYSAIGSTLLIEQPEIHLHPKVQSDLGDLLIELAKDKKTMIIETHSEHLLSRLTRRIVEGTIVNDDVAIYFFSLSNTGTKIERIRINELGQYENWPDGFFDETYTEALIHSKLISEKLNKEKERL